MFHPNFSVRIKYSWFSLVCKNGDSTIQSWTTEPIPSYHATEVRILANIEDNAGLLFIYYC